MKYNLIILLCVLLLSYCKKEKTETPELVFEPGMLINLNGSGCSWHIRLDNADENGSTISNQQT